MCDNCLKHGTAGKWYLNARNYSNEIVEEYNLREFLIEQYKNFEQIAVRKIPINSEEAIERTLTWLKKQDSKKTE